MKKLKTILVMPAYNAEATLEKTIKDIPLEYVDEILLVDDKSTDNTVELANEIVLSHPKLIPADKSSIKKDNKIPFTIIQHKKNIGYGGNQKNCYNTALSRGAEIIIMLHPDYQYDPKLIKYFVELIGEGYFDVVLGSRIRSRKEATEGGMPLYKYYANRILSFIQNTTSGRNLSEWHTGMRAYTKEVLKHINFNNFSNDFIFDTQTLFAIVEKEYSIGDIPVPVRYFKEASSINFTRSIRYGILTIFETIKFLFKKNKQFLKFIYAGLTGFTTNITIYALLLYKIELWYITSALISFGCGAIVSFTLQKFWVFGHKSLAKLQYEMIMYIVIATLNIFINSIILFISVEKFMVEKFIANIISSGIVAIWSFFVYKYVIFKKEKLS